MRYVAGMYGKKKGKKNKKKKMQNSRRQAAGDHKKKKRRTAGGQSVVWQMARQNMFRDKKQAAVIFLSFIIALSIFVTVNALVRGNEAERILEKTMDYDIEFKNETTLDEDKRQLITEEKIEKNKKHPRCERSPESDVHPSGSAISGRDLRGIPERDLQDQI